MAAVSGDQKQKLFVLAGFLGVLVLVGFFALRRSTPSESLESSTALAASPAGGGNAVAAKPVANTPEPKAAKATAPKPAKAVLAKAPIIPQNETAPLAESREDPFEPFYHPTLEPEPTPTPLPPPVQLPAPPTVSLPSPVLANAPPSSVLIGLPRPRVAGYAPLPGPIHLSGRGGVPKAPADLQIRSANKRLSGVIIGDSVRALLEITTTDNATGGGAEGANGAAAAATIVRVVQPGDEVDGIKILRIERVYEGGRQVTRMFIKEGNEERYVDLRASPTPPANAAGAGGASSEGGSPGTSGSGSFGAIRPAPRGFQRGGGSAPPIP